MHIAKSRFLPLVFALSVSLLLGGCGSGPSAQAQLQKAREYSAAGKNRAALVELRNLVKKHPDNQQGRLALGTLLLEVGDPAAAAVQLQRAQKLGARPENSDLPLAQALLQTGQFKEALAALHPEKAGSAKLQAAMLTVKGEAQIGLKQYQEAGKSFAAALRKDPRYARAIGGQASLELINRHTKAAIDKADKALVIDAKDGQSLAVKGMALIAERRFIQAGKPLQQALSVGTPQLSPSQLFMLRGRLVQTQIATGQREQALKNLELMLKQSPKQPYANYLRGLLAFEEKDYPTAVQHLQTALNANPYDTRALTLIGAAEAAQGHDVLATNYLSSALAQTPDNPMAQRLLASIQMRTGNTREAIDTLFAANGNVSTNEILSLFHSPAQAVKALTTLQGKTPGGAHRSAIDLALAQAFLMQGNSKDALSTLSTVKGGGTTALDAQRLTAAAFIRDGAPAKAVQIAEAIANQHAKDVNALHLASAIMLAAGSNKNAETILRKAEKIAPDNPATSNALGALMLREGRLTEATGAFESTLRHMPGNLSAQLALARVAAMRGQADQVVQWLDKAGSDHPHALAPLVILTQFQLQQHNAKQAVETAQRAAKLAPKAPTVLSLLGRAQLADKQGETAIKTFKAAAAAAPKDPRYALDIARAQLTLKDFKAAQATLTDIVAKHPAFIPASRALAMTQLHNKDAAAAFKTADKLATETNGKAAAEALKGDLYSQQQHYADANSAYLQALKMAPSQTLTLKAFATGLRIHSSNALDPLLTWLQQHPHDLRARVALASHYQSSGKLQDAEAQYRLALKDAPNNPVVLNNLAFLVAAKSVGQALPLAEKANRLAPGSPQIMDTYGWLLTRNHQPAKAIPLLRKAAESQKDVPQIQYHYAKALADTGQRMQAVALLTSTLKKHAAFNGRTAAEKLLKQLQGNA